MFSKKIYFTLPLLGLFLGCGSSNTSNTTITGAAIDDYLINSKVEIYNTNGNKISECKTGEYGIFNCKVKTNQKLIMIIKKGILDLDGNSSTTNDQSNFPGCLVGIVSPNQNVIISPLSTKLIAEYLNIPLNVKREGNNTIAYLTENQIKINEIAKNSDDIYNQESNLPVFIMNSTNKQEIKKHSKIVKKFMKDIEKISFKNSYRLRILHINDTHSHLEPTRIKIQINGEKTYVFAGGYAKIAKFVKDIKAKDKNSIFLHAGDAVQGTLYFSEFNGSADTQTLNQMNIDAMVLGNHEFDKGKEFLVKNLLDKFKFPIVDANVIMDNSDPDKKEFDKKVNPYKIFTIHGQKIAIVGETVDASSISQPGPTIKFLDYVTTAQNTINTLENKNINKIIFLTHIGYDMDKFLANEVNNIDVIVGGHSHTLLGDFTNLGLKSTGDYPTIITNEDNKTLILSAWKWGEVVGDINILFNNEGKIFDYTGTPVMLVDDKFLRKNNDGKKVEVNETIKKKIENYISMQENIKIEQYDTKVEKIINKYKPLIEELMNKVIGEANATLTHVRLPGDTDENGNVLPHGSMIAPHVALAMYEKAQKNGDADFSLQNAGGVRITIPEGNITIGEVKTLLPFGNTLVLVKMDGKKIKDMIENAIERAYIKKTNTGAFPYLGNAKFTFDASKPLGERIVEFKIKKNGNWIDLDLNKTYTIATNNYIANGGDNYIELKNATNKYDTGFIDSDTFIEYVKNHKVLSPLPEKDLPVSVINN
ncbi:bifunctional metallophosphatase/5'-nucleotidase [Caminibacter mediatlanticus]|uniref:NAD nucleotidase n=1 Tax=Caminibacter mediatlanticus TB-2 TaxID=391592 RepID=A0AAI9AGS5_9BACT|nr:5'-nucleotidase C-terminal domain-containing protein [Caminibacter mediatlanticus]EDM23352.1 NAD nucleotidase [Caminibacter mediatlanticus TB-2]